MQDSTPFITGACVRPRSWQPSWRVWSGFSRSVIISRVTEKECVCRKAAAKLSKQIGFLLCLGPGILSFVFLLKCQELQWHATVKPLRIFHYRSTSHGTGSWHLKQSEPEQTMLQAKPLDTVLASQSGHILVYSLNLYSSSCSYVTCSF